METFVGDAVRDGGRSTRGQMMSKGGIVGVVVATVAGAGVLLLGCCGGLVFLGFRSANISAAPHVEQLLAAMEQDDFAETYEELTTRQFRTSTTKQQYADLGKAIATRLGRLQDKTLKQFNMQQQNARSTMSVTYDATFERGTGTIVAQLEFEGGKWRFTSFRVNSPVFEQDLATETCI
jgi:hypothetical protein